MWGLFLIIIDFFSINLQLISFFLSICSFTIKLQLRLAIKESFFVEKLTSCLSYSFEKLRVNVLLSSNLISLKYIKQGLIV